MKKITLFRPYVSLLARIYALKVLSGTQLAEGPVVRVFEREFSKRFDKQNVVAVNSGTSALELAYELVGIGPGDEVITPVLTCTATNLPLVHRGAKIVFVDIDETLNISIQDVEKKITSKTKAIVFVHFGGNGSGLRQLLVLAKKHSIRVIEDAAQCIGAPTDKWGHADFTCVSLQAIKTLTAGDGGFLICRNPEDAKKAKRLRWFGYDRAQKQKLGDTDLLEAGYKYHMNDISAAIGLGNLRMIHRVLKKRARVRVWYRDINVQEPAKLLLYPWLTILIHPHARALEGYLKVNGVDCGPYHYRNDKYSVFGGGPSFKRDLKVGGLRMMDRREEKYTLLPFHHGMSRKDVERVCLLIRSFDAFKPYNVQRLMGDIWKQP